MLRVPEAVARLIAELEAAGFEAYAVGGCVRDMLLGVDPHDWDLCTNARPDETMRCFAGRRLVTAGVKHGTVGVAVSGALYEITTYRADGAYTDHRRPDEVRFVGALAADLMRRDFTVNAMAYHPARGLVDLYGGRDDLRNRVIRCVGDPSARFDEDALRILRALRFAARLDFEIEANTARAMDERRGALVYLSEERVFGELVKLFRARALSRALPRFTEVIRRALPEMTDSAIPAVLRAPADEIVRFALLMPDAATARAALTRLKSDNRTREDCAALVAARDDEIADDDRCLRRLLRDLGEENAARLIALQAAREPSARVMFEACAASLARIVASGQCYALARLAVNGADMLALGLRGARVGETLNALLDHVIDGTLPNERGALMNAVCGRL